jgi:hypothetical protein
MSCHSKRFGLRQRPNGQFTGAVLPELCEQGLYPTVYAFRLDEGHERPAARKLSQRENVDEYWKPGLECDVVIGTGLERFSESVPTLVICAQRRVRRLDSESRAGSLLRL